MASSISSRSVALKQGSSKPKRAARRRKISVLGRASPTGGIDGLAALQPVMAVGRIDVVDFEVRRSRQHDIAKSHALGHRDIDAGEEHVLALQALRMRFWSACTTTGL